MTDSATPTDPIQVLNAKVDALLLLVESMAKRRPATERRILSLNAAAQAYGTDAKKLRALFDAGHIKGREVPGRGRSGKELRLSVQSLNRLFRIEP